MHNKNRKKKQQQKGKWNPPAIYHRLERVENQVAQLWKSLKSKQSFQNHQTLRLNDVKQKLNVVEEKCTMAVNLTSGFRANQHELQARISRVKETVDVFVESLEGPSIITDLRLARLENQMQLFKQKPKIPWVPVASVLVVLSIGYMILQARRRLN